MRKSHARTRGDDPFRAGRLKEYSGIVSGFAATFAGALECDRSDVLSAVNGPVDPFMFIDGRKGTDNPGGATNQIRSDEHDRTGTDHIFIAVTRDQFNSLQTAISNE